MGGGESLVTLSVVRLTSPPAPRASSIQIGDFILCVSGKVIFSLYGVLRALLSLSPRM